MMTLAPFHDLADRPPVFKIALTGDVMLGRGIDQILLHPSPEILYEAYAKSALLYVSLAEKRNGAVQKPVSYDYVWGDMVADLAIHGPDVRIINLETAVTRSNTPSAIKGIHYRMNPANMEVLDAAGIDCCIVANNHVLDWGKDGLLETLDVLEAGNIKAAGAGRNDKEAEAPAILSVAGKGRVLLYAFACSSSGVPMNWAATDSRSGVRLLDIHDNSEVDRIAKQIRQDRQPGDIVIVSIHWGANWGYEVEDTDRDFAHRLINEAQVDVIHGHSSHHPKGIELCHGRPILYGCGDLINDYEGIGGEEIYRPDLVLLYLLSIAADGSCRSLEMLPYRLAHFRLNKASDQESKWLGDRMDRECALFGCRIVRETGADRSAMLRVQIPQ